MALEFISSLYLYLFFIDGVNAESTKGEWMKHVKYRANQIQTLPTEELHRVGLMVKYEPA